MEDRVEAESRVSSSAVEGVKRDPRWAALVHAEERRTGASRLTGSLPFAWAGDDVGVDAVAVVADLRGMFRRPCASSLAVDGVDGGTSEVVPIGSFRVSCARSGSIEVASD